MWPVGSEAVESPPHWYVTLGKVHTICIFKYKFRCSFWTGLILKNLFLKILKCWKFLLPTEHFYLFTQFLLNVGHCGYKDKKKKSVVSALSMSSMERQEMERVKIWNVSRAGLEVCGRSQGIREVSRERAAWGHSLEKNKKVLIRETMGREGHLQKELCCEAWCLEHLGWHAGQSHGARGPRASN